jgi:hypothetical protein
MMEKTPKKRRGVGRVAFLARIDDFRKLLEAGHSLLAIYEIHGDELGISYSQFARYVATYLRSKVSHEQTNTASRFSDPQANQAAGQGGKPGTIKPAPSSGFKHNPNSGNDRDDLI